jgi:hypothetical protein
VREALYKVAVGWIYIAIPRRLSVLNLPFRTYLIYSESNWLPFRQCCGSGSESGSGSTGSTCLWASRIRIRIRIHWSEVWIRILLSSCKNSIDSYYFVTLFDFLSLKDDVNAASKVISRKNCIKKLVFFCHLEGQ